MAEEITQNKHLRAGERKLKIMCMKEKDAKQREMSSHHVILEKLRNWKQ